SVLVGSWQLAVGREKRPTVNSQPSTRPNAVSTVLSRLARRRRSNCRDATIVAACCTVSRVVVPVDIQVLQEQLDAIERDAQALAGGLSEDLGAWRSAAHSWSVAECFDHLVTGNRIYLRAMQEGALRARKQGRLRHSP